MKITWLLVIALLVFVAVFSVQNADMITVRFLGWQLAISAALVIQLAALLGALVGLTIGYWSGRRAVRAEPPAPVDRAPPPAALPPPATDDPGPH